MWGFGFLVEGGGFQIWGVHLGGVPDDYSI